MFVEPRVQVKPVINTAPPEANIRHIQLSQQRDTDTQIQGSLLFGQAANWGQWEVFSVHEYMALPTLRSAAIRLCAFVQEVLLEVVSQTRCIDGGIEFA